MYVSAVVQKAQTADDVNKFMEANHDNTAALFFVDSSMTEGSEGGFWNNIISSVSHIFSGEATPGSSPQSVASIEKDVATGAAMLQIDVNNASLKDVRESYDVTTVPFLIVFKRGIVVLKEVPTNETHDKILQVLNVNPAAVHREETVKPAAPVSAPAEKPAKPAKTTPAPVPAPTSAEAPKHVTLAPGETEKPAPAAPKPRQSADPDERRKYVHHQCHEVTTYDDNVASRWRDSPFYIKELEDYEIPEEWWRSGYTPLPESSKPAPKAAASEVPVAPTPAPAARPQPVSRPTAGAQRTPPSPHGTVSSSRPSQSHYGPTSHVHGPTPISSTANTTSSATSASRPASVSRPASATTNSTSAVTRPVSTSAVTRPVSISATTNATSARPVGATAI